MNDRGEVKKEKASVYEVYPVQGRLPRFTQINLSARVPLFADLTLNQTEEFSDYKRFDAHTDDGQRAVTSDR